MPYRLTARYATVENDDFTTIIAFADSPSNPDRLVILQKAKEIDEQDKELGMDKIHIQVGDESRGHYGGITAISCSDDHLRFQLDDQAAMKLQTDGDIEIELAGPNPDTSEALTRLRQIAESDDIPFTAV